MPASHQLLHERIFGVPAVVEFLRHSDFEFLHLVFKVGHLSFPVLKTDRLLVLAKVHHHFVVPLLKLLKFHSDLLPSNPLDDSAQTWLVADHRFNPRVLFICMHVVLRTDPCSGVVLQHDAALAVNLQNVALDDGIGVEALYHDAIERARLDQVRNNPGLSRVNRERAGALDYDAVVVALLDRVAEDKALVVSQLHGALVDLHLVERDEPFDLLVHDYADVLAHHEHVLNDERLGVRARDVNAHRVARDQGVLSEDERVVLLEFGDDPSAFEVVKLAVFDNGVSFVDVNAHRYIF